jgi:hypothetical protein
MLDDRAEQLHPVEDPSPHWSDSLYFNAWDPVASIFCMTRIAVLPNRPRLTAGFLCWVDGTPVYGYGREVDEAPHSDWDVMTVGGLTYRMQQAQREWVVQLDDGDAAAAHLTWTGFTGMFDYADNPTPLPRAVAWGHYEQSCRVEGDLVLGADRTAFRGVGQRDHSWGYRDWAGLAEWHWITGFLGVKGADEGAERTFNLFHVCTPAGEWTANGFVHDAGADLAVVAADRRTAERPGRSPTGYELVLTVADGRSFVVAAEAAGVEVLVRPHEGDTVVHEVPMRLRAPDGLEGFGIYELLENGPS